MACWMTLGAMVVWLWLGLEPGLLGVASARSLGVRQLLARLGWPRSDCSPWPTGCMPRRPRIWRRWLSFRPCSRPRFPAARRRGIQATRFHCRGRDLAASAAHDGDRLAARSSAVLLLIASFLIGRAIDGALWSSSSWPAGHLTFAINPLEAFSPRYAKIWPNRPCWLHSWTPDGGTGPARSGVDGRTRRAR